MKEEAFTAVVPVIVFVAEGDGEDGAAAALEAGADEVLTPQRLRRARATCASSSHCGAPSATSASTPPPACPAPSRSSATSPSASARGESFAVCYADLDHFKEFNDRYGYHHGDRVILIVSRILRDVVRAHSPTGFVGHIGGDDFIFSVPLERPPGLLRGHRRGLRRADPLQYSEADRERGFFRGKDRRGQSTRCR